MANLIHKLEHQARIQGLLGQSISGVATGRQSDDPPTKTVERLQTAQELEPVPVGSM